MRQKLITLDPTSWDLAQKKPNFSQWVRDMLRAEDNKRKEHQQRQAKRPLKCVLGCGEYRFVDSLYCLKHYRLYENPVQGEEE